MKKFLFLLSTIAFLHAEAIERVKPEAIRKYDLAICAIFKNEAPYLKEWIEYHQLIGAEHFYLYNNRSFDRFRKTLEPYIRKGIVTLVEWPDRLRTGEEDIWPLSTQVPAYENAILRAAKHAKWFIFLDVNEFLVPSNGATLLEILKEHEDAPGLLLETLFFHVSSLAGSLPQRRLIIETTELTEPPPLNPKKLAVKMVFKPNLCKQYCWPPYQCLFKNDLAPKKILKEDLRIQHYVAREAVQIDKQPKKIKKINSSLLSDKELAEVLHLGYDVEENSIHRFVPEVLKRMGLD